MKSNLGYEGLWRMVPGRIYIPTKLKKKKKKERKSKGKREGTKNKGIMKEKHCELL